jgi:hypothetical protein
MPSGEQSKGERGVGISKILFNATGVIAQVPAASSRSPGLPRRHAVL